MKVLRQILIIIAVFYLTGCTFGQANKAFEKDETTDFLKLESLLSEAESYYRKGNYEEAVKCYEKSLQIKETVKAYSELYAIHSSLNYMDNAEFYFGKLVEIAVKEDPKLKVKLLFEANDDKFPSKMSPEYNIWLKQIALYLERTGKCIKISGHASKIGTREHSLDLSTRRAKTVQHAMSKFLPNIFKISKVVGEGFDECKKCTGTDDIEDVIDRRVEFEIRPCEEFDF